MQVKSKDRRRGMFGISWKAALIFLPLLAATVFVSGDLSLASTRRVMTRIAMRSLAYKAEELEQYAKAQWELLAANGLSGSPEYDSIAKRSVASYASTMIRTATERIFALDAEGVLAMGTGDLDLTVGERDGLRRRAATGTRGWVSFTAAGTPRVGHGFPFEPFAWYVVVSEDRQAFFGAPRLITLQSLAIFATAMIVAAVLGLFFTRLLTRPLQRMVGVIRRISAEGDLTRKVAVEYNDEVGLLASEFNEMIGRLAGAYEQVQRIAQSEREARHEVALRESETLEVLGRATDYRNPETGTHVVRVGLYAAMVARRSGADEESQALLRYAAPLHDIGKLGIPDSILLKPGALDADEQALMRGHTLIAWEILRGSRSKFLQAGAAIARSHHERWDGSGYPDHLRGEEIPLFGRIVGLVDVFDSLTSSRPYKKAWSEEEAFAHLEQNAGVHFDPRLAVILLSSREEVARIHGAHPD